MAGTSAMVIAQPTKRKESVPTPSWRLYTGSQQRLVQEGLRAVWDRYGFRQAIDETILSPWHGPLEPEQVVHPYDFTWKGRPREEVASLVQRCAITERLQERVAGFDFVLVLLSRVYLAPLLLPDWVPSTAPQRWLFFTSGAGLPFVPSAGNVRVIAAGKPEARREGVKVLDLKAHLFRRVCIEAAERGAAALEDLWLTGSPTDK